MNALAVEIVELPPMVVASFRAVSKSPERDAWAMLRTFAEPRGLLEHPEAHPVFGFNNPNPTQELEEYGYELWIRIEPNTELGGEIETKDFPGGLYAVARCSLYGDPRGNVLEIWKQLWDWVQSSKYSWRNTHELEKAVDARVPERDLVLDLYLPIE